MTRETEQILPRDARGRSLLETETSPRRAPAPALRVLHVIPTRPDGRSMIFAKRQIAALSQAGVAGQSVFTSSRTDPRVVARDGLLIRRLVRSFRPHVIHAHYGTVTAMLCACVSRVPVVITFRGSDLNPVHVHGRARAVIARLLSQCAALRAARVICVSEGLKQRLWWRAADVAVIPDGVDLELFYPRPRDAARRELGWPEDDRVVLFQIGGNPRVKRLDLAEAAFALARAVRPDLRLHLIGVDEPPARMPLLLNAADCVLLTSDYEGSPNIVKEALACDVPVVSVDVGDVAERLAGVAPSRLVDRSERAIAEALVELAGARVRSNGAAAVRNLSQDRTAQRVLAVYHEAMAVGAKRYL
jgi:teichuronic acid biosynthesis glycosyltransferase TuaC